MDDTCTGEEAYSVVAEWVVSRNRSIDRRKWKIEQSNFLMSFILHPVVQKTLDGWHRMEEVPPIMSKKVILRF
jgi:hypothetical protein